MKTSLKLNSNKLIELPSKIVRKQELINMQAEYIHNGILLNFIKDDNDYNNLSYEIQNNMSIIHYKDFSATVFSEELLKDYIKQQIKSNSDFIIIPYFKNESQYDISVKIELTKEVKIVSSKEIILEISYKSDYDIKLLETEKNSFDFISIFYGVHYGYLNQIEKIVEKIIKIKSILNKRVFCFAVPLKFAGAGRHDPRYMPIGDLICDGWIKNWKPGRGNKNERKIIDLKDLKSKNYTQWLETGNLPHDTISISSRTVYDMFHNAPETTIKEYHNLLSDEILIEIKNIDPNDIESYICKFHMNYWGYILLAYGEKVILENFKLNNVFSVFSNKDKLKLEYFIREKMPPSMIYNRISELIEIVESESIKSISLLIEKVKNREKFNKR